MIRPFLLLMFLGLSAGSTACISTGKPTITALSAVPGRRVTTVTRSP